MRTESCFKTVESQNKLLGQVEWESCASRLGGSLGGGPVGDLAADPVATRAPSWEGFPFGKLDGCTGGLCPLDTTCDRVLHC
jgi:hypothetical protein